MIKGKQIYHILFREPKIVFTVIPKNANTSVKVSLLQTFYNKQVTIQNVTTFHSQTLKIFDYIDNQQVHSLEDYLKIVVTRNPFDRLVSGWKNKIKDLKRPRFGFTNACSFDDFIKIIYDTSEEDLNRHFIPQYRFVTYNNQLINNYIIKMEELDFEWPKLQELIKKEYNINLVDLPFLNFTNSGNYKNYFSDKTKELVEDKFKKDLELFNYRF